MILQFLRENPNLCKKAHTEITGNAVTPGKGNKMTHQGMEVGRPPPFTVYPFVFLSLMPPYGMKAVLTRILSALASLIPLIFISSFFGA